MKKIVFLFLFFTGKAIGQNFNPGNISPYSLPKQGAWMVESGNFACHNMYILNISNDTLMLHSGMCTTNHSRVLAKFKVIGNQIFAKIFITIDYETNVGSLRKYDKKSDYTFQINLCEIFNKCPIQDNSIFRNVLFREKTGETPKFIEQKISEIPPNFDDFADKLKKH